ncbi:aquaporin, partial [Escherichia coli]|nr:aquaporin [Escherichia coli]
MFRKLAAECFGTFWLVFGGCGSAVLAAGFPELGIGFAGVALAFGLTVLTMAFAVGHISGGHFNPAVTIGLWAGGRFPAKEVVGYVIAQVVGGIVAAAGDAGNFLILCMMVFLRWFSGFCFYQLSLLFSCFLFTSVDAYHRLRCDRG